MPRLTRIYTRTGDDGSTGLGTGERVSKDSPRIEVYGTLDELNALIGLTLTAGVAPDLEAPLRRIQNELFHAGSELCLPGSAGEKGPRIEARHVEALERLMDELNETLPPLENFVLPGGHPAAAHLHVARTVCRRAERELVRLMQTELVGACLRQYLNRLSDALFVMARRQNHYAGIAEPLWDSRA